MVTSVTFRGGGETTGGVSDRRIETAKQETTGGVGARNNQDSVFTVDNELKQDTVCFRGHGEEKNASTSTKVFGTLLGATAVFGLLAFAHKYNWAGRISNGKFKEYSDVVTKPCHDACIWVKNNCYEKVVNFFKTKKP